MYDPRHSEQYHGNRSHNSVQYYGNRAPREQYHGNRTSNEQYHSNRSYNSESCHGNRWFNIGQYHSSNRQYNHVSPVPTLSRSWSLPAYDHQGLQPPTFQVPSWYQTSTHRASSGSLLNEETSNHNNWTGDRVVSRGGSKSPRAHFSWHPRSLASPMGYPASEVKPPFKKSTGVASTSGGGECSSVKPSITRPSRHAPIRPMVKVNEELLSTNSTHISVVSYNLLAQDLLECNMYLYSERPENFLDWNFRKKSLLAELKLTNADILCLQEVQADCFTSWLNPQLSLLDYTGLYKKRTGSHTDGCAIFYKHGHLKLLDHKALEYRRDVKVLDRDNVGLIAKFSPRQNGSEMDTSFCVATTHLLYNPKAGEVKLAQLSCLLAELHKIATIPGSEELLPTILCGDMNCIPRSPLYNFIVNSSLDYSKMPAVEIAGFHKKQRKNSRVIPIPLLPPSLNIGSNCRFTVSPETQFIDPEPETQFIDGQSGKAVDEVIVISDSECGTCISEVVPKTTICSGTVTDSSPSQSSHAGPAASSRRLDQNERSGLRLAMEWQSENLPQPCHVNSEIDNKGVVKGIKPPLSATGGSTSLCSSHPENKQRQQYSPNGLLTHPFRFQSAYPYSSHCSTVTTFHQSAFETVDYLFYSPACNLSSAIKEQGEPTSISPGFHLLSRKVLPSTRVLLQLGPQPHEFLSSDHLFLQATFELIY